MNLDRNISSTQIVWGVGLLIGLGLAAYIGSAVGSQDLQTVILILGAFAAIGMGLFLGRDYWMLIPFSVGANFPAVPLGGRALEFPELAIAGCSLLYVIRIATRKEKLRVFQMANLPILLFMGWVGMIFALNPIGLAMLGSSVGGGRFYIKLALAFAAFLIMSNRTYTQRDMKWVFGFMIFGAIFSLVYNVASYFLAGPVADPTTGIVTEEFYSWHQELSGPALTIAFLIFARWSPRQVFSLQRPLMVLFYALCFLLVLLSGKRMALVAIVLAPMVSAIVHRQWVYIFLASVVAACGLTFIVVGQGQWFSLPLVAQRTVSWLPGDWDPELQGMGGGSDEWRAELRRFAIENIKRYPILGQGFGVDISETMTAIGMSQYGGGIDIQTAAYALGRAWHNRWLGYAADFGIPLSVIQAILYITILVISYKAFRCYGSSNLLGTFALYVFISTVKDVVASHTSGHTAQDAFGVWWMYGIAVAVYMQSVILTASNRPANRARVSHVSPRALIMQKPAENASPQLLR